MVIQGAQQGQRFALDQEVVRCGRDSSNTICMDDTEISRQHVEIRCKNDEYSLVDLGSSNGTYLNGREISHAKLSAGDRIQIGQTVLLFATGATVASEDLARKISMITQKSSDGSSSSRILKSISQAEGSQFFHQLEGADIGRLRTALSSLRVIYEVSQAVSQIVNLDELLSCIVELTFQSIPADRGCVLLHNEGTGEYECRAVHYRQGISPEEEIELSRTIVEYVVTHGEGVHTSNAATDDRFRPGQSIMHYGIREAICAPIQGRHLMVGVIYLDNRRSVGDLTDPPRSAAYFTDDQLKLLIAIGRQAALAVEDSRYYQELMQSERLAAVGQTIATLSHHIKNVLQGIKGGSHLLEMGLSDNDPEQVRHGWTIVNKNQAKIYNLVMDMLTYTKEREPLLEDADLNEVVDEVVELMRPRAEELGVELSFVRDQSLPRIAMDPEGIHRAVLNVVANALDATEQTEGGRVDVTTRFDSTSDRASVQVRDNGVGIAPEQLPGLFTLFSSTKGAAGTGIGLAVSEKIVREHGGNIQVESQAGVGSEFTIELPKRRRSTSDPGTAMHPPQRDWKAARPQ